MTVSEVINFKCCKSLWIFQVGAWLRKLSLVYITTNTRHDWELNHKKKQHFLGAEFGQKTKYESVSIMIGDVIFYDQWCQPYHTLSSMVSNFVSSMPSMVLVVPSSEWSTRALLNLTSWSTASLPTRASPTNSTRSGLFTRISCTGVDM